MRDGKGGVMGRPSAAKPESGLRGQPLDRCANGHPEIWNYRDKTCPLCALIMENGEQRKVIERLQKRCEELEAQQSRTGGIDGL